MIKFSYYFYFFIQILTLAILTDKDAYTGTEGIANVTEAKEKIVLNSINILMKRGIKGLYIYASDEALRNKLLSFQRENI
ncbi:DNA/RNA helicase domain-containing protein [Solibacillus sp. FSL W8-0474]|uniref:DNA/RNA helicase domain-containing protein n=1 Tax=Solibacillus sp. FSL W8-0474 TaxID=2975336 RepID=UPI0030F89BDE